jgi:hypothetical protein
MCSEQMEGQERRTEERKIGGSGDGRLSEPVRTEPGKTALTVGCRVGAVFLSVDGHLFAGSCRPSEVLTV